MTIPTPNPKVAVPGGQARGDATRARLLSAALDSFASRGFHGTGTRDIAQRAGMSPSAVYVHFRTKEELLYALSLAGHQHALEVVEAAAAAHLSAPDQLREVVERYSEWHALFHTNARVVQYELAALHPDHLLEIVHIRRATEARVRAVIRAGAATGEFSVGSTHTAALAVLSLGIDIARWYREDGTWTPKQIAKDYGRMALSMVGWHAADAVHNRAAESDGM